MLIVFKSIAIRGGTIKVLGEYFRAPKTKTIHQQIRTWGSFYPAKRF